MNKAPGFIVASKKKMKAEHVTIVGAGVAGLSWTGLFLANGLSVTIYDPRRDIQLAALSGLERIKWDLQSLGYPCEKFFRQLSFEQKLNLALSEADIVQESIPEDLAAKQSLFQQLEKFAPSSALLFSSSAGIPPTLIAKKMHSAERMLVAHCMDSPHVLPLVEVVPGPRTSVGTIERAMAFYRRMGKRPIRVQKEVTGFVANRLHLALLREGLHLVRIGAITVKQLDEVVQNSLGLRWAAAGPFKTLAIWGGPGHLAHLLDADTRESLCGQLRDCYSQVPLEDMTRQRDDDQMAILNAIHRRSAEQPEEHAEAGTEDL